jgi:hypothetical protein
MLLLLMCLLCHVLQTLKSYRGSILFGIVDIVATIPVTGRYGLAMNLNGA